MRPEDQHGDGNRNGRKRPHEEREQDLAAERGAEKRAELAGDRGPVDYLRHFYYDTIGYHDAPLRYLKELVGADRILMGSDYCFPIAYERPVEIVSEHASFDEAERSLVLEGNARRLLRM